MTHSLGNSPLPSTPTPATAPDPSVNPPPLHSLPGFWDSTSSAAAPGPLTWLWHGYLAAGNVTVLTSQWKSGKTTLVAVLLARLAAGGQLAGQAVRPGRAVVVSEESPLHWYRRSQKLPFGDHVAFLCRSFLGKPTRADWAGLIDALVAARAQHGLDLVVIDPLANFLPGGNENLAASLVETLSLLQKLTSLGVSVWILHHPRKGETRAGQASRGSGALGAYADILLEMRWFARPTDPDRRRVIEAYSRHEETPRRRVIELTADGTDYVSHGALCEDDFAPNWEIVHSILAAAGGALTRREIRQRWPTDRPRPDETTVWRWLERVVGEGLVEQVGLGRRNDPFRFQLAAPEHDE